MTSLQIITAHRRPLTGQPFKQMSFFFFLLDLFDKTEKIQSVKKRSLHMGMLLVIRESYIYLSDSNIINAVIKYFWHGRSPSPVTVLFCVILFLVQ